MTLKHVLKYFSKKSEDLLFPRPLREREELLSEQSELSNSGEGCVSCAKHTVKDLPSNRLNVLTTLKKAAFTLAEVLITLGIIGVVAAMTLPTLIQNHQKQAYVTGLKKAYANLQNAFAKMAYDEDVTEWSQTYCFSDYYNYSSEECFNRFKKQFNVVKGKYLATTEEECWHYSNNMCHYIYTNDGMLYLFDCGSVDVGFLVDVNGDKGPNKWGRDRFNFHIEPTKNKIIPVGTDSGYSYQTYCTTANVNAGSFDARTCTAKVLIEGKMDY